ncbi:protein NRT1/ PTR FAMILY 5.2-like isoform X1 [Amaranthus tricolor]|uniref:protein NRT1/ PTR FAMILY 5.2-like isoform X1 n=1 Tax=Amaranthus tricolor TaxID=29722 RepID=UPI00258519A5|nr:protein NRT1/ PTR FAMILY 5.2-like isoform X1 [Amaranthus tricolor]
MAMSVEETGLDDYTKDGTTDLKGNLIRRSKRGGWRACFFVVVYEVFERMAFYGITTNLVLYMTRKLHQGTVESANNVTNWVGTIWMTPILGAYVADAYLGRYPTFLISCAIYFLGMLLLTLSVSIPGLKPPPCNEAQLTNCKKASPLQLGVFYGALYTLAIGTGGTKPNISTFGADQFDDFEPKEKAQKISFFNWWMFSIFFGTLFSNTILVYIQDNVGWSLGYGLPTLGLAISISIFIGGTPFYRHRLPSGSPFTKMAKVIVAAIRNRKTPLPSDPKKMYELDLDDYTSHGKFRMESTSSLRYLNKAAVITGSSEPWKLCTVTQVEETKQMLKMIPILVTTFIPSTMLAQVHTLFVKQGTTLNRSIGEFNIPPASLTGFTTISMLIFIVIYDKVLVKLLRKITKNPRGITMLQRMGFGLILHTIIMIVSSLVERKRLSVARQHGLVETGAKVPLTIFILLPQFMLMGVADGVLEVAKLEFFYDQAPEGMKSLGTSYAMTSIGIGNYISSFLLSTVSRLTTKHGHQGWILNNLNASHLDYYYAFFVLLNMANFILFLFISKFYTYKAEISNSLEVLKDDLDK